MTARIAVVKFTGKHPDDSIKTVSIEALATLKRWELSFAPLRSTGRGGTASHPWIHMDVIQSEMIGVSATECAGKRPLLCIKALLKWRKLSSQRAEFSMVGQIDDEASESHDPQLLK